MRWAQAGSALMFLGVTLGAFGAHALKSRLSPDLLAVFETGVKYQIYHALALFAVAWLGQSHDGTLVQAAGWLFSVGILLFSGSLYALAFSGIRILGAVTPLGGLAFLAGWLCLFLGAGRAS